MANNIRPQVSYERVAAMLASNRGGASADRDDPIMSDLERLYDRLMSNGRPTDEGGDPMSAMRGAQVCLHQTFENTS